MIRKNKPIKLELDPGDHYWCSCGKSKNLPFCDNTHVGSKFKPVKKTITEKKSVIWCNCQLTNDGPFCDGSHKAYDS